MSLSKLCIDDRFKRYSSAAPVFKMFKCSIFSKCSNVKKFKCSKCHPSEPASCVLMIFVKQNCGRVQMEIHSVQMTEIEGGRDRSDDTGSLLLR